ncbi:MAG: hypothetical protein ALAOOOJD_00964 [bacterium]|nr:hypothetical protein [bacterium]
MKILQICPRIPFPLHDGGAIGIFNITKHLALRGHQITMLAFGKDELAPVEGLREYCDLSIVPHVTATQPLAAIMNVVSRMPYTISKYQAGKMFRQLGEIVAKSVFDIVHVDHLHMASYGVFLKERHGLPIVLRQHNVEAAVMERFIRHQKSAWLRWYAQLQYRKLLRLEPNLCEQFDCCVMITPEDRRRLQKMSPRAHTTVIPAGVDIPRSAGNVSEDPGNILFLASLDWPPNVDGFMWFYENVLPLVQSEEPGVRVSIIGKGQAPRLQRLKHPNIRFIGFVNDVVPYLQAAQICIVPLFAGGGMRIKILEMLAHRKCVVSTSVGCEGIEAANGRELLIADDPTNFAKALLAVLRDPALRLTLGRQARQLVEMKYAWPQIGAAFESVYSQCILGQHD